MSISSVVVQLATLADNFSPSLRKVLVLGIGTLGLMMGFTFIALSIYSTWKTGNFDMTGFGTGGSLLIAAMLPLPLALAKAMQWAPDTTVPASEEGA